MTRTEAGGDRRWPRSVYRVGSEPDPRFSLANERTFLAWIRTSLGFLAAGAAVAAAAHAFGGGLSIENRLISLVLILCGFVCAAGSYLRWSRAELAIRTGRPLPSSPAMPFVTAVLAAVAVVAILIVGLV